MPPKISILISARKNSKYLAKFLMGFFERTDDPLSIQVLVMMNQHDTWNLDLMHHFMNHGVEFYFENMELGRAGLHEYFNELYKHATGDWIIYFCEDHYIIMNGWDRYLKSFINGYLTSYNGDLKHNHGPLDWSKIWCIIPKFDNAGAMNQILSRGYCEAIGGKLGNHGWIDSYINDLNLSAFGILAEQPTISPDSRILRIDEPMFHDFTHDIPNPMSDAHMQSVTGVKGKTLPKYKSQEVRDLIKNDTILIKRRLEKENA